MNLDQIFRERTEKVGELATEILEGFAAGRYTPLPRTEFALTDAPAAFRRMSQAKHIGKIVLTAHESEYRVKPTRAQHLFRKDGSYLITGGLGGFGLAVAKWMVSQGARNIALMGRSAAPMPENQAAYDELMLSAATVRVLAGDVSVEADVTGVLATMRSEMAPVAGVIHGAMVLRDRPLIDLTPEDWQHALAPKVCGAWLLDRLTKSDDLDCFVLFSSAASIFGNPMQANYAAANAFLEALAQNRRARGLPGLAVCWGVLSGAGYVSRQPEIQRYLESTGLHDISLQEAFEALEMVLRSGQAHAIAARMDWGQLWRAFPGASRQRFSAMSTVEIEHHTERATAERSSVLAELRQEHSSRRSEIACTYVVRQVARVLSEPESKIDAAAPLTNLGLDSLMAVELQTLFQADLGVRVPATRLLQGITVRGLADLIVERIEDPKWQDSAIEAKSAGAAPRNLPLAFEQMRLWFLQQLHPESPVYNVPMAVRFSGELDRSLLHRAVREVAQRHEALRATVLQESGEPRQRIAAQLDLPLPEIDLSPLDAERREAELGRVRHEEAERPFAFNGGPLMRAKLLRLSGQEHVLLVTIHHLIVDAWSMPIIALDTALIYQRLINGQSPALPSPAPGYADFVARQQSTHNAPHQLAYWKKQLSGAPRLKLPTDRPHPPVRTFAGARLEFPLDRSLLERLEPCGRSESATLFMTLLTAFQVLLYRYSGQDDFCVGAPVATRAREEAMDRVGCLVNTLALRARINGGQTFREVLRDVRQTVLEAYEHQDVTWERVVESVNPDRDPSIPPIFQVLLVVHRIALDRVEFPGLVMSPEYTGNRSTTFDLVLLIDTARCEVAIEYNTDIFDASMIDRVRGHWQRMLDMVPSQLDVPVRELPIFAQELQALAPGDAAPASWRRDVCLHHLFEEQARRTPNVMAVFGESQSLTYAQLDHAANRLARQLQTRGVGPESRVAICAGRSPLAVAGIVAILKAGGAFVPLDPAYPRERLAFMLRDSSPELLLAEPQFADELRDSFDVPPMTIGVEDLAGADPVEAPTSAVGGANLAYLMYTSGSSGQPKGVMIEHGAISNQVQWRQSAFPLDSSDAVLHTTSLSFDPSIWEIFGPLAAGAAVVIPEATGGDGNAVRRMIRRHGVTVLHGVPSLLRSLLDQRALAGCDSLRHVFCGGEPLDNRLAEAIRTATGAAVHQLYGCTETSIDATCLRDEACGHYAAPPVGRPIGNVRVYVLDGHLQPVPCGVSGEVYIAGAGVARGYWNQPELTASRFLPDPFHPDTGARMYRTGDLGRFRDDGDIELLGRMDRQIKLRGLRIEPLEIEASVRQHPFVRDVVVDLRTLAGEPALVAWCALEPGHAVTNREVFGYAAQRLPRSLVPRHWVFLESLPATPACKIDLAKLPDPEPELRSGSAQDPPRSAIERRVAAVWEELLAIQPIELHENFFDVGGHSLLAARLAARLSAELGVDVPVSTIMSKPTIAELAKCLSSSAAATDMADHEAVGSPAG
jgi:amino acid adenylation domain-containing protein